MSRFLFIPALILFLVVLLLLLTGHQGFSVKVFNIIFWVLFAGVIIYLVELKYER